MLRVLLLAIGVIVVVSLLPVESTQPSAFADPAFARFQRRAGEQGRALLWGGDPLVAVVEPYVGAPGDRRLVEYYERGRMELDDTATGGVTEGLLVREMVTGAVQQGDDVMAEEPPADVPILGGADPERADLPTYAEFQPLTAPAAQLPHETIFDTWIDGNGAVSEGAPPVPVVAGQYVAETGHTIPAVFAEWERTEPFGAIDTLRALGYPITEPYWTQTGLGDGGVSLIQLFERRVVVYTPDLPVGERFSLTSAGRHYFRWRYGSDPLATQTNERRSLVPAATGDDDLTMPDGLRVAKLSTDITGIVAFAVAPNGDLALAHEDGSIRIVTPDGDLTAGPDSPFVDGLSAPVALAYSGTDLFVLDADGLYRFRDDDGDRVVDDERTLLTDRFVAESVALVAGPNGSVVLFGQRVSSPKLGQRSAATARSLIQVEAEGAVTELTDLDATMGTALVVDDSGTLWMSDAEQQLQSIDLASDAMTPMLDASALGTDARITDLLVYRPDGANGDPRQDMLALVLDDDGGRIIRLKPALKDTVTTSSSGTGTPVTQAQPGAIIDFITGFDRPSAMAAGLDGSLYVLDIAKGSIFRIHPE